MSDPYAGIGAADPYASIGKAAPPPKPAAAPTSAADAHPSFIDNLIAPGKAALEAVKSDIANVGKPKALFDFSDIGHIADLALSPITGIANAVAIQPGANLLDKIPLDAYAPPKLSVRPDGLQIEPARKLSPAEKHAANASMVANALMALGPKGIRAGAVGEAGAARYAANVAEVVNKVPPEVALDDAGALTDEGKEAAVRANVHPEDVQTAYKAVKEAPEAAPVAPAPDAAQPVEAQPAETPLAGEPQPAEPITPPPQEAPQAPPEVAQAAEPAAEPPLSPTAAQRVADAAAEGIDLTRGQATQDFETQAREQALAGATGADASAVRQFFGQQQQQIADAIDRFKAAFGDVTASAADRGQIVKDALTALRDAGKAGVSALYRQARDLAQGLGEGGENLIHLDTAPLLAKLREIWTDEAVPDQVRKALKQQAAKYGLIGDAPKTVEGETTVTVKDNAGEPAGKITFTGPPQRLTIVNAEDLRQKINSLYEADTSKASQALKPIIDDAVQAAVERAAQTGPGDIGKAFQAARAAHVAQQKTFSAKDVVQKLIDWKRGTETPVVLPEHAIEEIFKGGPEALTNLKKVKAVLLSKPTEKTKAAWEAIQAHALSKIFDQAMVINANPGSGALGAVSGAKLNTAIAKFGADKLKVLLGESDFNRLMKLRRVIGDATIPIQRTTNPSGSGWAVIRYLADQAVRMGSLARHVPVIGHVVDAASGLARVGKEGAEARETARGVTGFTPEAAAKVDAATEKDPLAWARRFLAVGGSNELIAPILSSAANEDRSR